MSAIVRCGRCGQTRFDLHAFDSLLVLDRGLGLFELRCPACGGPVQTICAIPADLQPAVREAAAQVGAGMGGTRPAEA